MSAPMHPTMQQLADSKGVSRRLLFQAAAVHRYGCPELVKAAHSGVLPFTASAPSCSRSSSSTGSMPTARRCPLAAA